MKNRKSKLIAIVTAVFMLLTVCMIPAEFVSADSSSTDVKWTDGITGGAIYFDESTGIITKCDTSVTEAIIPEEIDGVKVIGIGEAAFWYCNSLTSITIPNSVKTIGDSAFYSCESLASVTIPDRVRTIGDSAFRECDSLTSVTIPDRVTTIGSMAFYSCDKLTSVIISGSVTTIEDQVFNFCNSLTNITVEEKNEEYCSIDGVLYDKEQTVLIQYPIGDSRNSFIIPDSVRVIGNTAFNHANSLTSVTIPNGVKTIGDNAFGLCYKLTSITIPNSVRTIGNEAFYSCTSLTNVTISNGVKTIGAEAFRSCKTLTSVTIPDSVKTIGDSAFGPCKSLTNITVEENNENYSSKDGVLYDKEQTVLIQYPVGNPSESYAIPNSVTTIGESAFYSCDSLISVTIPDTVKIIENRAFGGCDELSRITIPNSVTTIGDYVFFSCDSLTRITIPDSVTTIGNHVFSSCDSLTSIIVEGNNKNYSSKDGVLYDKEQTVLIQYPVGNNRKSYAIPDSVTTIGESAFDSCESLTSVVIPDSVMTIEDNAFPYGESLTIYGYKGSYAEDYAQNYYFTFKAIISDAPDKVTVNLYKDYDDLKVSWNKVAEADGYYVYYKKSTWSSYKKLGRTTKLTYTKTDLTDGKKYKFRVYPYMNIDGQKYMTKNGNSSGYVYTLKKLNKPSVKKSSHSYVKISWNNIKGESGYEIARSKYSTKKFTVVKRVSKKYKSTTIKTPRYKKYYYKVRAYKTVNGKKIYGPWSSVKSYRLK